MEITIKKELDTLLVEKTNLNVLMKVYKTEILMRVLL